MSFKVSDSLECNRNFFIQKENLIPWGSRPMKFKPYLLCKDETPDYTVFTVVIQLCIRAVPVCIPHIFSHQLPGWCKDSPGCICTVKTMGWLKTAG